MIQWNIEMTKIHRMSWNFKYSSKYHLIQLFQFGLFAFGLIAEKKIQFTAFFITRVKIAVPIAAIRNFYELIQIERMKP